MDRPGTKYKDDFEDYDKDMSDENIFKGPQED